MPIWNDDYLLDLQRRGEIDLSTDVPCIFNRFSLTIANGVATYSLPAGILSIIRITWKGRKIWPYDQRNAISAGIHIDPLTETSAGTPIIYVQHHYGFDKINFWPVPDETIGADDSKVWGASIDDVVVVSCWQVADPTGSTYRIPEFLRRRLIKNYVNMKAYGKEGPSQDTQAVEYFKQKYNFCKDHFRRSVEQVPKAVQLQMQSSMSSTVRLPRPRLPIEFGEIVE